MWFFKNFFIFLAVIWPWIITAVADNDAWGVATYTVAASIFWMASQYFVLPTTILLAITQEVWARLAIVTWKWLWGLIREKYWVKIALLIFIIYFVVNQWVVLQNVAWLKSALQLFNIPVKFWLFFVCILLTIAVIKLNYKKLQNFFFLMVLFYAWYVVSAFLAHPNWWEAFHESFVFPRQIDVMNPIYWFTLIAVLGTTITAWGQFFISNYIVDKWLTTKDLWFNKIEIYTWAFLTNFLSWMMAIAVTYTIFKSHTVVTDGFSAALAIKPLAWDLTYMLFAVWLFVASLLWLLVVPLATAYVFADMFWYERTLDVWWEDGKTFYIIFIIQVLIWLIAAILPSTNLFGLTIYADFLNWAMLPLIFYFLIKFCSNSELMGEFVLKGFSKIFLYIATIIIIWAVVISFVAKMFM